MDADSFDAFICESNGMVSLTSDFTSPCLIPSASLASFNCVSKDLAAQFTAGTLLKDISQILGGKGGGRPDLAQGAVTDRTKLKEALNFLSQKIFK